MTKDERRAHDFVSKILLAANRSAVDRAVIAAALLEAGGALARQDIIENPTRFSFYAEATEMLSQHVLGSEPEADAWRH